MRSLLICAMLAACVLVHPARAAKQQAAAADEPQAREEPPASSRTVVLDPEAPRAAAASASWSVLLPTWLALVGVSVLIGLQLRRRSLATTAEEPAGVSNVYAVLDKAFEDISDDIRTMRRELAALAGMEGRLREALTALGPELAQKMGAILDGRERTQRAVEAREDRSRARAALDERLREPQLARPLTLAVAVDHAIATLEREGVEVDGDFSSYRSLARDVTRLRQAAETTGTNGEQLGASLDRVAQRAAALTEEHRPLLLLDIVDRLARKQSLRSELQALLRALGLEEVPVQIGSLLREVSDLDVVGTEGTGQRPLIDALVLHGYRSTENGVVVRRPRVRVRLQP